MTSFSAQINLAKNYKAKLLKNTARKMLAKLTPSAPSGGRV